MVAGPSPGTATGGRARQVGHGGSEGVGALRTDPGEEVGGRVENVPLVVLAESESIAPEALLVALLALLLLSVLSLVYAVGGFVVARRFGAGDRSRAVRAGMVLVVLIGATIALGPLLTGEWPAVGTLVPPLAHVWALRLGRREAATTPPPARGAG